MVGWSRHCIISSWTVQFPSTQNVISVEISTTPTPVGAHVLRVFDCRGSWHRKYVSRGSYDLRFTIGWSSKVGK
eukprot:7357180-Ditylum_brightwellii.AAC.1